jgi:hypothetical protein
MAAEAGVSFRFPSEPKFEPVAGSSVGAVTEAILAARPAARAALQSHAKGWKVLLVDAAGEGAWLGAEL